jgi:hypothetical protein
MKRQKRLRKKISKEEGEKKGAGKNNRIVRKGVGERKRNGGSARRCVGVHDRGCILQFFDLSQLNS